MRNPLDVVRSRSGASVFVTILGVTGAVVVHAHRPADGLAPGSAPTATGELSVLPEPHYQLLLAASVTVAIVGAVLTALEIRDQKSGLRPTSRSQKRDQEEAADEDV